MRTALVFRLASQLPQHLQAGLWAAKQAKQPPEKPDDPTPADKIRAAAKQLSLPEVQALPQPVKEAILDVLGYPPGPGQQSPPVA